MNVLNALQKQMGKKGIAISLTDDKGVYTKYFLFSQTKQADKFYNSQKKLHGNKISVKIQQVIY